MRAWNILLITEGGSFCGNLLNRALKMCTVLHVGYTLIKAFFFSLRLWIPHSYILLELIPAAISSKK